MSSDKFLMFSLEDESSKKLGEIISNQTARKILNLVAEKELSQGDISKELNLPLNTIGYNIDKLVKVGLIIESKSFWSVKGRKIPVYEVARKHIVISPKKTYPSRIGNFIPVVIIALIFSIFILSQNNSVVQQKASENFDKVIETGEQLASTGASAPETATNVASSVNSGFHFGLMGWFLIVVWLLVAGFVIYSLRKK